MFIYNITTKLDFAIKGEWLHWQHKEHIPAIMATQQFIKYQLCKLLHNDTDGVTYTLQFFAPSEHNYSTYQKNYKHSIMQKFVAQWGNSSTQLVSFESLMEVVDI